MVVVEREFVVLELLDVGVLLLAEVTLAVSKIMFQSQMRSRGIGCIYRRTASGPPWRFR